MPTKVISLRLPAELAAELAVVARADDMPVSEAIRKAIESYIIARGTDQAFKRRLRQRLEEDRQVLKRLEE